MNVQFPSQALVGDTSCLRGLDSYIPGQKKCFVILVFLSLSSHFYVITSVFTIKQGLTSRLCVCMAL